MAVNVLLSFAFYATYDVAAYRAKMPCGRLMIDSGAYTAYTTGEQVSLAAYAEYLEQWRGHYDHAVTLDVIGDPAATRRNTRKLHGMGHPVMPVFTRGGTAKEFAAMVRDAGYVCVGGGVGMPPQLVINRLGALQRRAEELGGGIHALGVGNLNGIRKIKPYSCDASNISTAFKYGGVVCYDGRTIQTFSHNDRKRVRANLHHLRAQGIAMAGLVTSGRQPGKEAGRNVVMQGISVAYLCADEDTTRLGVPVPTGVADTQGTHLYSSVMPHLAPPVAELDALVHTDWTVPMWTRYRPLHARQCRAAHQEATA